jgi:hypothetical protein
LVSHDEEILLICVFLFSLSREEYVSPVTPDVSLYLVRHTPVFAPLMAAATAFPAHQSTTAVPVSVPLAVVSANYYEPEDIERPSAPLLTGDYQKK